MSSEVNITEEQFDAILEENRHHGRALFNDLLVVETEGPKIDIELPRVLPRNVIPRGSSQAVPPVTLEHQRLGYRLQLADEIVETTEKVKGLEEPVHQRTVWYEKVFDKDDKFVYIRRHEGGQSRALWKSGSHYHVSSLDHLADNYGPLGRAVIALGEFEIFGQVLGMFNYETGVYRGEVGEPFIAYRGSRPPEDLGMYTLRAFIMGFRERALDFGRVDIVQETDKTLDRLTY